MRLLIDTHAFLWFVDDSPSLPVYVRSLIKSPENDVRISMASFWEIGIKASVAKMAPSASVLGLEAMAASQFIEILPITVQAIHLVQHLPYHHKDPFDRIIAATALVTGDLLLSADLVFDAYRVPRAWESGAGPDLGS